MEVEGAEASLFGGAQYHRLMKEFHAAVRSLPPVAVLAEDITNAMGVSAHEDPIHIGRVACAIALHRSSEQLGLLLARLFERLRHVMRRMLLFVMQQATPASAGAAGGGDRGARDGADTAAAAAAARLESLFERQIWGSLEDAYRSFLHDMARHCAELCRRDLHSVARPPAQTGVVGGGGGVGGTMAALSPLFVRDAADAADAAARPAVEVKRHRRRRLRRAAAAGGALGGPPPADEEEGEEAPTSWAAAGWYAESEAVDALVRRTVGLWRKQWAQAVQRKVHALFLMPFLSELPATLSASLEACCEPESIRGFDLREARAAMLARREQLTHEKHRTTQLLRTFLHVRTALGGAAAQPTCAPAAA